MAAAVRAVASGSAASTSSPVFRSSFRFKQISLLRSNATKTPLTKKSFSCNAIYKPQYQIKGEGPAQTLEYRVFFHDASGKKISPWHDILPLHLGDGVFNFVVEIPKESSAKMKVATDEPYTPIKQDTKKGKLRHYP